MPITLDGSSLTIEKLVAIARDHEKVELAPEALERIKVCRLMLEEKLAKKEIMYGTNTGIGEFSETMLNDEQVKEFQKYLIYNHAAGIGEPAPIEHVRAALAGRVNVHAHGNSGCRSEITLTLVEMLNKGVTPVVCQKGSVGASGASPLRVFLSIILPPLQPAIITVIVTSSVGIYNDFTGPLYFLPGSENVTAQLTLFSFMSQFSLQWNLLFADVVIITIPPLIMFMFFQRQIVSGMTAGAVKG